MNTNILLDELETERAKLIWTRLNADYTGVNLKYEYDKWVEWRTKKQHSKLDKDIMLRNFEKQWLNNIPSNKTEVKYSDTTNIFSEYQNCINIVELVFKHYDITKSITEDLDKEISTYCKNGGNSLTLRTSITELGKESKPAELIIFNMLEKFIKNTLSDNQ